MLTTCRRCGIPYTAEKNHSSLRLSYCGVLCEVAELGFVIDQFLKLPARRHPIEASNQETLTAACCAGSTEHSSSRTKESSR